LGLPVDPELYSQKAMSSRCVSAGLSSPSWALTSSSRLHAPSALPLETTTGGGSGTVATASPTVGSRGKSVTTARAQLSWRKYA
jgi:hypothetical protein